MNTNIQPNTNDTDTTLALFATLNDGAQAAFMNLVRLADAIRAGVLPDDMREATLGLLASAFDGVGKGQGTNLT